MSWRRFHKPFNAPHRGSSIKCLHSQLCMMYHYYWLHNTCLNYVITYIIKFMCALCNCYLIENYVILKIWGIKLLHTQKNLGQYDRPRLLGCEPVDGVLIVLSSNQLNIATFVYQMEDVCVSHLVNKWFMNLIFLFIFSKRRGSGYFGVALVRYLIIYLIIYITTFFVFRYFLHNYYNS